MKKNNSAKGSLIKDFISLKRLWPYLKMQKHLVWTAFALLPFISLIEMCTPFILKWTIDEGIAKSDWQKLRMGALAYLVVVILQYAVRTTQSISAGVAISRMIVSLRKSMVTHVLNLSCSYHDRSLSGALVTRATSDFDNLSESLQGGVLSAIIDFAVLIGAVVGLIYLSWQLSLYAAIVLPLVYLIVTKFSQKLKDTMLKARVKIAELNAYTQECLYGSSVIKLLNAQPSVVTKHDRLAEDYRKVQMGAVMLDAGMFSVIDGISSITMGLVLYFALSDTGLNDFFTAGIIVAFIQYIQRLFEPVKQLSNKIAILQGAFNSIDRIFGILQTKEPPSGSEDPGFVRGGIRFEHVSFYYHGADNQNQLILDDVNFSLEPGQSLALVGATGSGKSTIIKLLTKLYTGYSGKIWLDHHDLSEVDGHKVRQQIAIVPQEIVLFEGTIAFNIGLGQPNISREDIERAAITVGADHFIRDFPLGYDQPIMEQGHNLSHGMRQLIAFARALAKRPSLIVLDEATSSVDPESEAVIQKGINSLMRGHTVVVIAHRLSTIRDCNQIVVLERGKIVEQGSHQQLMENQSSYFKLHQALT